MGAAASRQRVCRVAACLRPASRARLGCRRRRRDLCGRERSDFRRARLARLRSSIRRAPASGRNRRPDEPGLRDREHADPDRRQGRSSAADAAARDPGRDAPSRRRGWRWAAGMGPVADKGRILARGGGAGPHATQRSRPGPCRPRAAGRGASPRRCHQRGAGSVRKDDPADRAGCGCADPAPAIAAGTRRRYNSRPGRHLADAGDEPALQHTRRSRLLGCPEARTAVGQSRALCR